MRARRVSLTFRNVILNERNGSRRIKQRDQAGVK